MSVWKKIESKVLASGVDMRLLEETLKKEFDVTLDFKTTRIRNTWGSEDVDCALVNNGRVRALGFRISKENGIELVGDIYGSGLGGDGDQEVLMNKIAQMYQKFNMVSKLSANGWNIENIDTNEEGEVILDIMRY